MGLDDFELVDEVVVGGVEALGGEPVEDGGFDGFGGGVAGVVVGFIEVDVEGDEKLGFGGGVGGGIWDGAGVLVGGGGVWDSVFGGGGVWGGVVLSGGDEGDVEVFGGVGEVGGDGVGAGGFASEGVLAVEVGVDELRGEWAGDDSAVFVEMFRIGVGGRPLIADAVGLVEGGDVNEEGDGINIIGFIVFLGEGAVADGDVSEGGGVSDECASGVGDGIPCFVGGREVVGNDAIEVVFNIFEGVVVGGFSFSIVGEVDDGGLFPFIGSV